MYCLFNNGKMDSLRSLGFLFIYLFELQGKLFSHVNILIAVINWVNMAVHFLFRTVGMQLGINIEKGNCIYTHIYIYK